MSTFDDYEPAPDMEGVRLAAKGVLALLIAMGCIGWFCANAEVWPRIGMCAATAIIEIWGFNCAAQWSNAMRRDKVGWALFYWTVNILSCSGWTMFSTWHALSLLSLGAIATPAYIAFLGLSLALPFHAWAIDETERARLKRAATLSIADTSHAAEGVAKVVAKKLSRQKPKLSRQHVETERRDKTDRAPPVSEQEVAESVAALTERGKTVSLRAVAMLRNVPVSRVERSPGKHLVAQANAA